MQREHGFAVLNDATEGYGRLSYYISRDAQERQLQESDFTLLECTDRTDSEVGRGADAYRQRELFFVARPGAPVRSDSQSADENLV